jgi:hypothetical protein
VATGDINGDGVKDITTAAGHGGGPHVRIFSGASGAVIREFMAYSTAFRGGVSVAVGDVDGDGTLDVVTGAGAGGGPHVRVFSGMTGAILREFMAYDIAFPGGVNVAAGDTNHDNRADIMTGAGPGGGPHVRVFDGATGAVVVNIIAYNPNFRGGVNVAALPGVLGGTAIVIAPGAGGGPDIRVFVNQFADTDRFFAYDPNFLGGVNVGVAPIGPGGTFAILTGAGPGGGPHVKSFVRDAINDLVQELSFFAFDPSFMGGVFVG